MKISNLHEKMELKKGPWTREEDQKLLAYVEQHGHGSWRSLPEKAGLQRCGKSCRLRWTNYLRPDIKRGKFTSQEDKTIIRLHALLGNRWSAIASHVPKRTDNEIKNYWNTRLKKRLTRMGIDPTTHKPKNDRKTSPESKQAANLSHLTQWETTRLEAEERLVRESKLLSQIQLLRKSTLLPPPPPPPPKPRCLDVLKVWQATNQDSFFNRPVSLESPTSTLNFSSNSSNMVPSDSTVQKDHNPASIGKYSCNNACGNDAQLGDNLENLFEAQHHVDVDYGTSNMLGPVDEFITGAYYDHYEAYNIGSSMVEEEDLEIDHKRDQHWNELLNLVITSQMQ